MKEKYQPHRFWILILIILAEFGLLWMLLIVPGKVAETAESALDNSPEPIWHSFRLSYEKVGWEVDVYENYLLWDELNFYPNSGVTLCNYSDQAVSPPIIPLSQIPTAIDTDICIYNLHTGLLTNLSDNNYSESSPKMNGDWIVFIRESGPFRSMILYNIITGQEIDPGGLTQLASQPVIYGDWVAFSISGGQMYAYRISTDEVFMLTSYSSFHHGYPDIHDEVIVWQRSDENFNIDILGYDLASSTLFTISSQLEWDEGIPKIYGDIVVWDRNKDIYGYDLSTGQYMTITNDPYFQTAPNIYENLVVWADGRHGSSDIYGLDLQSGETFSVTQENPFTPATVPNIWGDVVTWRNSGDYGAAAAIKMTDFSFMPLWNRP